MNILILISSLNYGGAEKQALLDANMLSQEHTVYLGTFFGGKLEEQLLPEVTLIRIEKSNYLSTAFKLIHLVKQHKIQIIHAHLFASSVISAIASLFADNSVIWHFHAHRYENPTKGKSILKWLSHLRKVKKLLFVNTELMEYYQKENYGFPVNKCAILYNSTQQSPVPGKVKEEEKIKIGFIGRIIELKRVEYLIELAQWLKSKNIDSFEILIVGDGPEKEKLQRRATQAKVSDLIRFEGFQLGTPKYYAQFDIFILPSREECLSIALIDAGVWGIPSIAFSTGGNDEIIKNGITGYIVKTKEELFEKTRLLMNNQALRITMGNDAQTLCRSLFDETKHLESLNSIYTGILT